MLISIQCQLHKLRKKRPTRAVFYAYEKVYLAVRLVIS